MWSMRSRNLTSAKRLSASHAGFALQKSAHQGVRSRPIGAITSLRLGHVAVSAEELKNIFGESVSNSPSAKSVTTVANHSAMCVAASFDVVKLKHVRVGFPATTASSAIGGDHTRSRNFSEGLSAGQAGLAISHVRRSGQAFASSANSGILSGFLGGQFSVIAFRAELKSITRRSPAQRTQSSRAPFDSFATHPVDACGTIFLRHADPSLGWCVQTAGSCFQHAPPSSFYQRHLFSQFQKRAA